MTDDRAETVEDVIAEMRQSQPAPVYSRELEQSSGWRQCQREHEEMRDFCDRLTAALERERDEVLKVADILDELSMKDDEGQTDYERFLAQQAAELRRIAGGEK